MSLISWYRFGQDILASNNLALKAPYRYFLVVTKSCQSRCQHCKIWQEKIENELSLEEISKLAKNSPWLKWLNVTGGEPTDRDDLPSIFGAFKKYCPDLVMANFTTNGLEPEKIEDHAQKIASLKIPRLHINVSIDGPPEINDHLRGINGDYDLALETFKRLRRITGLKSSVAMTLFKKNHQLINQTFELIKNQIPDFDVKEMHLNVPHQSAHYYQNEEMKIDAPDEILSSVEKFYSDHKRETSLLSFVEKNYQNHAKEYLLNKKSPLPCSAVMSSVYISEKGEIYPCTIWDKPLGNIRDHEYDVRAILFNDRAKKARSDAQNLKCPQCWTPCEAFPSILANIPRAL
ncbi:MAG: radical SAM protein [Bacteriovoracaceae bacterium]|nr:radical SAM protein [Bacteriovoracaceae bacterium]